MPAMGRPCGCTPSAASSATAPGIRPSPHALSIAPERGSRTTTDRPARWAWSAAASPTGPPPATTTSYIGRHPRGERREGGVLGPDPDGEEAGVEDGED